MSQQLLDQDSNLHGPGPVLWLKLPAQLSIYQNPETCNTSKQFSVDSPDLLSFSSSSLVEDRILQSCLHSMNRDVFSDPFLSYCFSLLTGLLLCVAICTGPEGAIKITSVFLLVRVVSQHNL